MKKTDMKLLAEAVFGSVDTYVENEELVMRRFTQHQIQHFDQTHNYIEKPKKSKASSGMNIDFYTDATQMYLELSCSVASSQPLCYVDIYVDGVMEDHFGYNSKIDGKIEKTVSFKPGSKRITIWLPCLFEARIANLSLNSEDFAPAKKDIRILFEGDSITQGYTSQFPSLTYTNIVTRGLNADGVNQGIGGALFDESDPDDNLPFSPDIVVISYGTNDWSHSRERDFESNASAYLSKMCEIYKTARIFVVTPIWRGNIEEKSKNAVMSFDEMHVLLEDICRNFGVEVIDGMKLVPHRNEFFVPDLTHPNEMGFLHYGNNLLRELER